MRRVWATLMMSLSVGAVQAEPRASQCYGTTVNGRVERAVALPLSGPNFESYGQLPVSMGRTHVHSAVRDILLMAWQSMHDAHPDKIFKYAETGLPEGGPFPPHRTHQNGLSVDLMTPMISDDGVSTHLPTDASNRFGYDIELDEQGRLDDLSVDHEALAAWLWAVHAATTARGYALDRVIFDPALQQGLASTAEGERLMNTLPFSTRRAWVRHDEHLHIDFRIPCEAL